MSATGFENPEFVDRAHDRRRDQRHSEMADRVEQLSTKEWLQEELDRNTKAVPVMGRDFEFRPIGSDQFAEVMEMTPDQNEDISMSDLPKMLRQVTDILGEHCTDPEMDAEAFGKLDPEVNEKVFTEVATGGELTDEERKRAERFLEE